MIPGTAMASANANGITLEYDTFGHTGDPTLVLIMGFAMQMIAWDERFCTALAGRGFRVVRFDNRDVGLSSRIDGGPMPNVFAALGGDTSSASYSLDDMADDVAGLLDALDVPTAHIVGASMGGMIAQLVAIRHPSRVTSLASIMSTTGDRSVGHSSQEAMAALLTPPPPDREGMQDFTVNLLRVIGSPGYPMDEAMVRARSAHAYDRGSDPLGVARQFMAIVTARDRTGELARVTVPTVVIHGAQDPLIQPDGGEATARAIPGARLVLVPGMGHDLPAALWPTLIDAIVGNANRAAG